MAIENQFLESVTRLFNIELPIFDTMDEYLDFIIPQVKQLGEDLSEKENYLDTRWLEVKDGDQFHESVLHIFRDEGEYIISIDGNISRGQWRILSKSNTLILDQVVNDSIIKSELFDLAFLDKDFFILKKHGDQSRKGFRKYFVLGRESAVRNLEWRDDMELLFNRYRSNPQFVFFVAIILLAVAIFVYFSIS